MNNLQKIRKIIAGCRAGNPLEKEALIKILKESIDAPVVGDPEYDEVLARMGEAIIEVHGKILETTT